MVELDFIAPILPNQRWDTSLSRLRPTISEVARRMLTIRAGICNQDAKRFGLLAFAEQVVTWHSDSCSQPCCLFTFPPGISSPGFISQFFWRGLLLASHGTHFGSVLTLLPERRSLLDVAG